MCILNNLPLFELFSPLVAFVNVNILYKAVLTYFNTGTNNAKIIITYIITIILLKV